jgi:hypothetical protein
LISSEKVIITLIAPLPEVSLGFGKFAPFFQIVAIYPDWLCSPSQPHGQFERGPGFGVILHIAATDPVDLNRALSEFAQVLGVRRVTMLALRTGG